MHPCVAGSIVNIDFSILICNPASRLCYHLRRIFERRDIEIQHITQTGGAATDTVSQMKPAFGSLDRGRAFAVLLLLYRMIMPCVYDFLAPDDYMLAYFPSTNSGCRTTFLCCEEDSMSGSLSQFMKSFVLATPAEATADDRSPGAAFGSFLSTQKIP